MTMMTHRPSPRDLLDECRTMDGSLNERLAAFAEGMRRLSPAFAATVDRLVARLEHGGAGHDAPRPGDTMPSFLLPDGTGHLVGLEDLLRAGPVALTFNRGHWCPYCRISIAALAEAHRDIVREGAQIAAITPDRQPFAGELKANANGEIPVLVDVDNSYALSLGLAFWVGDEMKQLMTAEGQDLANFQGNESWLLPIPATFVVGQDGKIKARFVDPDYRRRMAIEDLLAAIRENI
jgi:peroxiredoxin